jgi:hypothetical protein
VLPITVVAPKQLPHSKPCGIIHDTPWKIAMIIVKFWGVLCESSRFKSSFFPICKASTSLQL